MTSDNVTTTPTPEPLPPTCPECGAQIHVAGAPRCWLCQEALTPSPDDPVRRIRLPGHENSPPWGVAVGFFALLLCIGLVFADAVGVLIVMFVVSTPALVRTVFVSIRQREAGAPASIGSVLMSFLASLGIVVTVGIVAATAFFATCFAVGFGVLAFADNWLRGIDGAAWTGMLVGGILAFIIFVLLMRRLWPRKK